MKPPHLPTPQYHRQAVALGRYAGAFPLCRKPHTVITMKIGPGNPCGCLSPGANTFSSLLCVFRKAMVIPAQSLPLPRYGAGIQVGGGARPFHVSQL